MWVVYGSVVGRCNTSIGVERDCEEDRGGVFDPTKSNTWKQGDQQFLGLNEDLGLNGSGQYGQSSRLQFIYLIRVTITDTFAYNRLRLSRSWLFKLHRTNASLADRLCDSLRLFLVWDSRHGISTYEL